MQVSKHLVSCDMHIDLALRLGHGVVIYLMSLCRLRTVIVVSVCGMNGPQSEAEYVVSEAHIFKHRHKSSRIYPL